MYARAGAKMYGHNGYWSPLRYLCFGLLFNKYDTFIELEIRNVTRSFYLFY